jgi:hypothetical protein
MFFFLGWSQGALVLGMQPIQGAIILLKAPTIFIKIHIPHNNTWWISWEN